MQTPRYTKLNLGAGEDKKEGYINVDWSSLTKPDVVLDLNVFPYAFPDNSFELIEAFHLLEHLEKPFSVMRELHRILKPGGQLHIKVPHFSRGMTHAEHEHGFDVTFPLYFNPQFTKSGYFGVPFKCTSMRLRWMAFFHLMPSLGYGRVTIGILRGIDSVITGIANVSPAFTSRIWCFWVGGFEEIEYRFCKDLSVFLMSLACMNKLSTEKDKETADAFATSWNNLPEGSVYTLDQFIDWMAPLTQKEIQGKRVLELGCGNASLMVHMLHWKPSYLEGVDLGDSVKMALKNLSKAHNTGWKITQHDLTTFSGDVSFDVVYCIGVLHHLKDPRSGFEAMVRNTTPGGRFHGWVYAREGNTVVRLFVDPIRKIASRLPWWFTKYALATPLVVPFFIYAKILSVLPASRMLSHLPLHEYSLWISKRDFLFFRHVAFDQLVTPQTAYIPRSTVEVWLRGNTSIEQGSTYIIRRNGNSWKFGGRRLR